MNHKVLAISFLFIFLLSPIVLAEYGAGRNYFVMTAGQISCYPTTNNTTVYPGTSEYQNITVYYNVKYIVKLINLIQSYNFYEYLLIFLKFTHSFIMIVQYCLQSRVIFTKLFVGLIPRSVKS